MAYGGTSPAFAQEKSDWTLVRYTPEREIRTEDLAVLVTGQLTEPERQRNNINRRLVSYPPEERSLAERRATRRALEAVRWVRFAGAHLEDGDVLFRLGRARTHFIMNFSRVTALATNSRYSHTGIFRWNDGQPEVVDITKSGFRVQSFPMWMREVADNEFAVRRVRPEYRAQIPQVLAFLEGMERRRPEFDFTFEPDNGKFYCNELTETAFRSAGIALSTPVPGHRLPGMHKVPIWSWLIETVGGVDMDTALYVAGNESYGMYGSEKLEAVYCSAEDGMTDLPVPAAPVVVALSPSVR